MAAPAYASDLSTILLEFPNTTGWTALGGGAAGLNAPETDYFIQNANCITKNAWASATKGMIYNNGSGITVPTDGCVMMWLAHATMNSVGTQAGGGIRMVIGSGSGDYDHWYVGGSDTEVFGLWNPYPVNDTVAADTTTGSPTSTLQYFGGLADLPSGGPSKGSPFAIDAIRYGRARIDITGGEAADYARWDDLEATTNAIANRYGNCQLIKGVYLIQGFFSFGTTGTAVDFRDSDKVLNWRDTLKVTAPFNRMEVLNASSNVEWTNIQLRALGTTSPGTFIQTSGDIAMTDCAFTDMGAFTFRAAANAVLLRCKFKGCGQITAPGTDMQKATVEGYTGAANTSAIVWDVATDPNGLLNGLQATAHDTTLSHAVEFGLTSPLTLNLRDWVVTGYSASNNVNDSVLHIKRTSGTVTVNVFNATGTISYRTDGATVSVVLDPVTTQITVKDEDDANLQNARVIVEAGSGAGDLPFEDTVTITHSTTTASVSHTSHGMANGDKVAIRGADQQEYNGVFAISNVTANAYDYTMGSDPGENATGTINATGVVLEGLTNASGQISASASYTVDQPVRGKIRKSTASPLYKSFDFTDTIDKDNGLSKTVQMIRDD